MLSARRPAWKEGGGLRVLQADLHVKAHRVDPFIRADICNLGKEAGARCTWWMSAARSNLRRHPLRRRMTRRSMVPMAMRPAEAGSGMVALRR